MNREITPWKLVVNSLYPLENPMLVEPDFWNYIYDVSNKLRKELKNVVIRDNFSSLKMTLWDNDPFIVKKDGKISLNSKYRNKQYFSEVINYGLDDNIKNNILQVAKEVYLEKLTLTN